MTRNIDPLKAFCLLKTYFIWLFTQATDLLCKNWQDDDIYLQSMDTILGKNMKEERKQPYFTNRIFRDC